MLGATRPCARRNLSWWLIGIASAALIVGSVLMQARQPTGGGPRQRTEDLLIRFDQVLLAVSRTPCDCRRHAVVQNRLPESVRSVRKLRQKMVHDMETATSVRSSTPWRDAHSASLLPRPTSWSAVCRAWSSSWPRAPRRRSVSRTCSPTGRSR